MGAACRLSPLHKHYKVCEMLKIAGRLQSYYRMKVMEEVEENQPGNFPGEVPKDRGIN